MKIVAKKKPKKRVLSQTAAAIRQRKMRARKKSSVSRPSRSTDKTNQAVLDRCGLHSDTDQLQSPEVVPMPTAGRRVTEFEDQLDASLISAEEKPKRDRRRPRIEAEQQPPEIDVKVIGQAIQIPFDLWAIKQDIPDLKISVQESVIIAKPLKQILDHYMPNVPAIAWAWISLSAVSYSILKTRLVLIAEIKKAKISIEQSAGEKEKPRRRDQGRSQSAAFPSLEEITKPLV